MSQQPHSHRRVSECFSNNVMPWNAASIWVGRPEAWYESQKEAWGMEAVQHVVHRVHLHKGCTKGEFGGQHPKIAGKKQTSGSQVYFIRVCPSKTQLGLEARSVISKTSVCFSLATAGRDGWRAQQHLKQTASCLASQDWTVVNTARLTKKILTFMSCSAFIAAWAWLPLIPESDPQGPLATCGKRGWLIRPVVIWGGIWLASAIGGLWTGAGKVLVCGALTNGGTRLGWERIYVVEKKEQQKRETFSC